MTDTTLQRKLAEYLLKADRMIVEPTAEMMQMFPMGTPEGDETAWLKAVAEVLKDATELRIPALPSGKVRLAVKDRAVLFNYTQERSLEDMKKERRANTDA